MTTLRLDVPTRIAVLAILAILVLATAATWFAIIAPRRSESSGLAAQIQVARATLEVRRAADRDASAEVSQGLYVRRALPDTVAMPQVILELSRVAAEANVSITSFTPAAAVPYAGFDAVPISVVVSGRFFAIETFLQDVRNQVRIVAGKIDATGRLFDVQGINLSLAATPPLVSATLTMDAFEYTGTETSTSAPTASSGSGT